MHSAFVTLTAFLSVSFSAPWLWVWLISVLLLGVFLYQRLQARSQVKVLSLQQKPEGLEWPSYSDGEVSEILFCPTTPVPHRMAHERPYNHPVVVSSILACPITKRLPKKPVVVSCGRVFDKSALDGYLRAPGNLRQDLGLSYTPGADSEPFFISDKGYGDPLRQHKVLEGLLAWWKKQPKAVQSLALSQPELFFITIDHAPIIENLALLMPGAVCPKGFLETWYDPAVFFQDPVIDVDGKTIDFPAQYRASACTSHRYNDLVFCTPGPLGPTTVIDKIIWVKPKDNVTERPGILSSFFDLSKLPESDQSEQAFVPRYYQDSVVDKMIRVVKPYLQSYASEERLLQAPPVNQARW